MIPIPLTIEDVTPELCRDVFVKICGGRIKQHPSIAIPDCELWIINGTKTRHVKNKGDFNPFVWIQDTLLCMPWVNENEIIIEIRCVPHDFGMIYEIELFHSEHNKLDNICDGYGENLPFVLMLAIIKAYNKIEEMRDDKKT